MSSPPSAIIGHKVPSLCCFTAVLGAALAGGAKPRWEKQLPEIANYLGWCTWDAFYHDVSAQGIANGLQSFKQAGVQPRWIIIDDGWQVRDTHLLVVCM